MNAPPFELVGIGILGIGFVLILTMFIGSAIVYLTINLVKRIR
jgi:hypothetical protein